MATVQSDVNAMKRWLRCGSNGTSYISSSDEPIWQHRMCADKVRSPPCRQTKIRLSWCCKQNRGFSESIRKQNVKLFQCPNSTLNLDLARPCATLLLRWISTEGALVCYVDSRAAKAMVAKFTSMLLQTSSNCGCRRLMSCKRSHFLTQGSDTDVIFIKA